MDTKNSLYRFENHVINGNQFIPDYLEGTKDGWRYGRANSYCNLLAALTNWMACLCFEADEGKITLEVEQEALKNIKYYFLEGFEGCEEWFEDHPEWIAKTKWCEQELKDFEKELQDYWKIMNYE
jgi:hypothetical protein